MEERMERVKKYRGTGQITEADYHKVTYKGKTKDNKPVVIELENAINMGNIDWTFAEKDDTVAQIVMTATYDNTDQMATETVEPWILTIDGTSSGAGEIMLGIGLFYIDETPIALSRGGGKFTVEREFREIKADGDRGPVKGRVAMEGSKATMTLNALQILSRLSDLYPAMEEVAEGKTENME